MSRGTYKLILTYVDVPLEDVQHTLEDCTHNGDFPAFSGEIEVISSTTPDDIAAKMDTHDFGPEEHFDMSQEPGLD